MSGSCCNPTDSVSSIVLCRARLPTQTETAAARSSPHTATACRLCLLQGLQEFRHANVRAGIRLASERVKKLRTSYLSTNGAEVKMAEVAVALTSLLSELETAEKHVGELPVEVGLVLRAPSVKNRCFWSAPGRMKVARQPIPPPFPRSL